MKKNRISTICLALAAVALVAVLGVGTAMAYFTTYVLTDGGKALELDFTDTEISEEVIAGQKQIVLTNTGDQPAYVRIKALVGDAYKDSIVYSEPGNAGNWTPGADGYYYYNDILEPGESTTQLNVSFAFPEGEAPADFNVIIIQESTPVLYDENGNPYADWSVKADIVQSAVKGEDEE